MVVPLILAGLIGAGATLISGFLGSQASQQAASSEAASAKAALDLQARTLEQSRADQLPWMQAGRVALEQYMGEIGVSSTGAGGAPFQSQFKETPGYQYSVEQGEKGVVNNLNALGMRNSGAALQALTKLRQGLASTEYNSYLNRLAQASGMGQAQANETAALSANSAAGQARSLQDIGAARASGYVGSANAWTNALGNFSNNMGSALGRYDNSWNYMGAF